jgi:hypothetical protein
MARTVRVRCPAGSSSAASANSDIWTCCGVDRPAVWLRAIARLSATIRSISFILSGVIDTMP